MEITEKQAQVLLQFMALAAEAAADDERFGECWRLHRFQHGYKELMDQFNKAGDSE